MALNILRIWLVTNRRASIYRGGDGKAKTLREEFEYYGLPAWFMYVVGSLKVAAAIGLIVGIWMPAVIPFSAGGLIILMIGAIAMHAKIRDKLVTHLPAVLMLVLSATILFLSY
ncbi:MAG: DoxX family protein [Bacteroidota bacterium]